MEPGAWGHNWATLSLGDINTGTWPFKLGPGSVKKNYCSEIQISENRMQYGRIFSGRLWLNKGCLANDDNGDMDAICIPILHSFYYVYE
jgi:hypothetical protein